MTLPPPEICRRICAAWVLMGAPDWTEADRLRLSDLLAKHGLALIDLPEIFLAVDVTAAQSRPKDKTYERLWKLFGQLSSDKPAIRTTARDKLDALLAKQKLGWTEFTAILIAYSAGYNADAPTGAPSPQGLATDEPEVSALDLILYLLDDYLVATPAQRMVIALWALTTHIYDRFEHSPRLGLISPTSSFGKTTLFKLLVQFASEPKLTKNASAAAIYRRLEWHPRTTYLLDEAENQGLLTDSVLRSILDGGYEPGGTVDRADEAFPVYFPCAYALRGELHDVPSSILSRSHVINMQRGTPRKRFDRHDRAFVVARELITKWWVTAAPDPDPAMPAPLSDPRNPRLADNCRPLLSVADSFGPQHGEAARAALIELCAGLPHSDVGVQVLQDIGRVRSHLDQGAGQGVA